MEKCLGLNWIDRGMMVNEGGSVFLEVDCLFAIFERVFCFFFVC